MVFWQVTVREAGVADSATERRSPDDRRQNSGSVRALGNRVCKGVTVWPRLDHGRAAGMPPLF